MGHDITYKLEDGIPFEYPSPRHVKCPLTSEQLDQLAEDGYVVLPPISKARLEKISDASNRMIKACDAGELRHLKPGEIFLNAPMIFDDDFLDLTFDENHIAIARAMLGPLIRFQLMMLKAHRHMDQKSGNYAFGGNTGLGWHRHKALYSDPLPRWYSELHGMDFLTYLDGANPELGALGVIPGSHKDVRFRLPFSEETLKTRVEVEVPPGGTVALHSNLWHEGVAAKNQSARRRYVVTAWYPVWYRGSSYEHPDHAAWTDRMVERFKDDPDKIELLGRSWLA